MPDARSYRVAPAELPMLPAAAPSTPKARGGAPLQQAACIACCGCVALGALALGFSSLHLVSSPPAFDCRAALGSAAAWSGLKKEYCCESEGIGCQNIPGYDVAAQREAQASPTWLKALMGDTAVGLKFMVSGLGALLLGCCLGARTCQQQLRAELAERRAQTEHELLHELQTTLQRVGAREGEISVTLMWDTKDDLDLHVQLPEHYGEISAENPECAGGRLDVDGNSCLEMGARPKPIEHIYWPKLDGTAHHQPPKGEYVVRVKAFAKHSNHLEEEANLTVVVSVQGKKDIYHLRLLPGCTDLRVGSFQYTGPLPHVR